MRTAYMPGCRLLAVCLLAAWIAGCAGTPSLPDGGPRVSREEAAADIRYAVESVERIHPSLYWNSSLAALVAQQNREIAALPRAPDGMDVYRALSRTLAVLGDGHVNVGRPHVGGVEILESHVRSGGRLLGLSAEPDAGGLRVLGSLVPGIVRGDLVRRINGKDALALFAAAEGLAPGEAGFKRYLVSSSLPSALWDLGVRPPFELTGLFAGQDATVTTAGQDLQAALRTASAPSVSYQVSRDGIGYVRLTRMDEALPVSHARFRDIFEKVARDKPSGLILDIRDNLGGSSGVGIDLLSFITSKSYRMVPLAVLRTSAACRDYYTRTKSESVYGRIQQTLPAGQFVPVHGSFETAAVNPVRFDGPVAVLIGPGTFSAANILANAIGDFRLATLIGQDTAEFATNYVEPCSFSLPHTGLEVWAPSLLLQRADGKREGDRDHVHPDIVTRRPPDSPTGADPDIETARRYLLDLRARPAVAPSPAVAP